PRLVRLPLQEDTLHPRRTTTLDHDPLDQRVAVDQPTRLGDPRDRGDQLRRLPVVRATVLRPPAPDTIHTRRRHRVTSHPERLAPLADQAVVLVEESLLRDMDPQLLLDHIPMRI